MDSAHLHLLVNHLPIIGAFLSLPLLGLAFFSAFFSTGRGALRAAALLLVLGMGGAAVSMNTGEGAEERVEGMQIAPGRFVDEGLIEAHEERAEVATWVLLFTTAAAAGTLALSEWKKRPQTWAIAATALLNVGAAGAMAWTGQAGGAIRRPELQTASLLASAAAGEGGEGGSLMVGGEAGERGGRGDGDGDDD